ncbi:hypothetical protein VA599_12950 [Chromobacterium sp. TRC.1.1.SA]|uniref:Uncharacterized protein n=1 Tax=Chromobacterium indicum TaxID=3110228 RepID=A0ABV0CKG2_9NEIS
MISSSPSGVSVNAKFGSMTLDGGAVEERAKKFNTGEASKTYDGLIDILKKNNVDTTKIEGLYARYEEIVPSNANTILEKLRIADDMAGEGKIIREQYVGGDATDGDAARTISLFPHVFLPIGFSISLEELETIGKDRNSSSEIGLNVVGDAHERQLLIVGGLASDGSDGLAAFVKTPGKSTAGFKEMNIVNIVHTHPREGQAKASTVEFAADVKGQKEEKSPALVRSHSGGTYLFHNEESGGVFNQKQGDRFSKSSLSVPDFAEKTRSGHEHGFPFHLYEPKEEGVDISSYKQAVIDEIGHSVNELNGLYDRMKTESFTADQFVEILERAGMVRSGLEEIDNLSSVRDFKAHFEIPRRDSSGDDFFTMDLTGVGSDSD